MAQVPPQPPGPTSYLTLLAAALGRAGAQVTDVEPAALWRLGRDRSVDLVHLHWLEFIAPSAPDRRWGVARTLVRHARLIAVLIWLRLRGIKLVWTVHNLRPHEPVHPRLEYMLGLLVGRISHVLVAHSAYARTRIQERWGRGLNVVVIPIANYIGLFPASPHSRAESRRMLGIPDDAYVFLAFGQVRSYKRLVDLIVAFRALERDDVRLLIAGRPVTAEEGARLRDASDGDSRVLLALREVPDNEVAGLHACADAAVVAYREVFSSAALLLALSFGLPVVAPDIGTAAELVGSDAGELFAPGGLTAALDAAPRANQAARAAAAIRVAKRYSWDRVGSETAALYRRVLSPSRT